MSVAFSDKLVSLDKTMSELLLDSLEIKGYRCFEHLTIEKLGRVNLIVGKNNVGKTALLEALRIYAERGNFALLFGLLDMRAEIPRSSLILGAESVSNQRERDISHLFHGRPHINTMPSFSVGNAKSHDRVNVKIGLHQLLTVELEDKELYQAALNRGLNEVILSNGNDVEKFVYEFIRANGLSSIRMSLLWDKVVLTELEDYVISAIQLISDSVIKISFVIGLNEKASRIAVVRVRDSNNPISIKSMGEGMNRLLGLALALVNCKDGILLIDEIESGLHYSVLPDVWRLIFKTARELNVQVFATTHSKDCIEAFEEAATEDKESEGLLIRLERDEDDKIVAKVIEEETLHLATKHEVEVR